MKQQLNQFREQMGWQGKVGIVLLSLAGIFQMLALQPLQQEVAFMHNHLDAAQAKISMQSRTLNLGDHQNELGMFFASMPGEQDVTDTLASIYAVAEASGVSLEQADYHPDMHYKLWTEYGMDYPVRGEYAQIRYFVARVLADHPAIALDKVSFQRDKSSDPVLKAQIRFTLFLH